MFIDKLIRLGFSSIVFVGLINTSSVGARLNLFTQAAEDKQYVLE